MKPSACTRRRMLRVLCLTAAAAARHAERAGAPAASIERPTWRMALPTAYQKLAGPGGRAAHARFCRTNAGTDMARCLRARRAAGELPNSAGREAESYLGPAKARHFFCCCLARLNKVYRHMRARPPSSISLGPSNIDIDIQSIVNRGNISVYVKQPNTPCTMPLPPLPPALQSLQGGQAAATRSHHPHSHSRPPIDH